MADRAGNPNSAWQENRQTRRKPRAYTVCACNRWLWNDLMRYRPSNCTCGIAWATSKQQSSGDHDLTPTLPGKPQDPLELLKASWQDFVKKLDASTAEAVKALPGIGLLCAPVEAASQQQQAAAASKSLKAVSTAYQQAGVRKFQLEEKILNLQQQLTKAEEDLLATGLEIDSLGQKQAKLKHEFDLILSGAKPVPSDVPVPSGPSGVPPGALGEEDVTMEEDDPLPPEGSADFQAFQATLDADKRKIITERMAEIWAKAKRQRTGKSPTPAVAAAPKPPADAGQLIEAASLFAQAATFIAQQKTLSAPASSAAAPSMGASV